jgi:hypothetical protein
MKPSTKSGLELLLPSTCRPLSPIRPVTTPAMTIAAPKVVAKTIAKVTKEKRTPSLRWKGRHANRNPTPTYLANGKYQARRKNGDFFIPVKFSKNTKGRPKCPHHNTSKLQQAALCIGFQCDGKCNLECNFLHTDPIKIPKTRRDKITSQLQLIFS